MAEHTAPDGRDGLVALADDLLVEQGPVSFLGLHLHATMAALRLPSGEVVVWAPLPWTPARQAAVLALGPIAHLVAPNLMHHLWIGEWAAAFPQARLHAPEGLAAKRPDLPAARRLGGSDAAFGDGLLELPVEGFRLHETALFHPTTGTLLTADLVHNVGRPDHAWTALYTRMMGFHDRVALSRVLRWTAFSDRTAARRSVDRILDLPIERAVLGHGAPLLHDCPSALAAAWTFLPGAQARLVAP